MFVVHIYIESIAPSATTTTQIGIATQSDDNAAQHSSSSSTSANLTNTPGDSMQMDIDEPPVLIPIENVDVSYDLGDWINKTMTSEQRSNILKHCWVPPQSYDFDADSTDRKRKFRHEWLAEYKPWLVYSKKLRGALCLYCVLFRPTVVQGVLGAFITKEFTKFPDMHDSCKSQPKNLRIPYQ